jgi:formate hydrogenlyase transcriptional activator
MLRMLSTFFAFNHGEQAIHVQSTVNGQTQFSCEQHSQQEWNMSSMANSIARVNRYQGNATMSTTLYRPDESTARKLERAQPSFLETIVGRRGGLRSILSQVEAVAPTNATVLITGETGTGKEVIARAIHELSPRRTRNLVKVNCAAMPAGLLESELFGHERGAFTGAVNSHIGRFALADRGTLFLDEIGDLPLELQPKLLRVLQEREFEAVGSTRTMQVDVRVVVATNRDLRQMVQDGEFREDLYYRLNIFPLSLPALRERKADIPEFVRYFVEQFAASMDKVIETIPKETMRSLVRHPWPGNIRELQNYVARGVILSTDGVFEPPPPEKCGPAPVEIQNPTLEDKVRQEILVACQRANWKLGGPRGAAARLGLKRTTLFYKMKRLGIRPPADNLQD